MNRKRPYGSLSSSKQKTEITLLQTFKTPISFQTRHRTKQKNRRPNQQHDYSRERPPDNKTVSQRNSSANCRLSVIVVPTIPALSTTPLINNQWKSNQQQLRPPAVTGANHVYQRTGTTAAWIRILHVLFRTAPICFHRGYISIPPGDQQQIIIP